jgi:hypothetical protein
VLQKKLGINIAREGNVHGYDEMLAYHENPKFMRNIMFWRVACNSTCNMLLEDLNHGNDDFEVCIIFKSCILMPVVQNCPEGGPVTWKSSM